MTYCYPSNYTIYILYSAVKVITEKPSTATKLKELRV